MITERSGSRLALLSAAWVLLGLAPCLASVRHPELASKAWLHAVELQQKLEAKPAGQRTAAEYNRVIREYRNVYLYDFAYVKAPVASQAMGDLYVEMGRQFHNPANFNSAIKYYQYTVSQYPGTSMARESALAVGNVYLEGLNDPEQAADAYRAFLEKYPSSSNSGEAKKKLKEIADRQASKKEQESAHAATNGTTEAPGTRDNHSGSGPVEVTEIHNWEGPNYTRVVIGAKGPFQYTTLRLSHPDRIVFDLPNTHLSHALLKTSVPVNGVYLHEIRAGQFKPDVTRIVLDVKDISEYSAFPQPNPFRLIIDVHGSSPEMAKNTGESVKTASAAVSNRERATQAPPEVKDPSMKQASASKSRPEVEAARRIAKAEEQKNSAAIEYVDQEAVKAKAAGTQNQQAADTAKAEKRDVTPPNHPVPQAPEAKSEVASKKQLQESAKLKAEFATGKGAPQATNEKTEVASVRPLSRVTKRNVEATLTDTGDDDSPLSTKPASPTGDGSQTLTRALGLKVARIVIDPGHGGFDTGTIGPSGLEEKNIVLDIGLRLRKLIETQTNSEVFMTRSTDKFIPLEERTAIANEDGADLFISIHANASRDQRVRGIETYFLNFTSDAEALQLAARENATSQESVHQLQNLIKKIALNNKIEESQELARDIQNTLYKRLSRVSRGVHNRGVRKAPFVVLIGANMPSVLAEISFLSNPHSEHLLRNPAYREQVAKALFNGIQSYTNNLGSVRMAQRIR